MANIVLVEALFPPPQNSCHETLNSFYQLTLYIFFEMVANETIS
jgi:hypothetical protein